MNQGSFDLFLDTAFLTDAGWLLFDSNASACSCVRYMRVLEPYFNNFNDEYSMLRNTAREILQLEDSLSEIVQLVGKESLSEDQKVRVCVNDARWVQLNF